MSDKGKRKNLSEGEDIGVVLLSNLRKIEDEMRHMRKERKAEKKVRKAEKKERKAEKKGKKRAIVQTSSQPSEYAAEDETNASQGKKLETAKRTPAARQPPHQQGTRNTGKH